MNWSNNLLKILTLRCEEASMLASRELDEPLGPAERLALRGHALVCGSCRAPCRQLQFLHGALQQRGSTHEADGDNGETLSDEARAGSSAGWPRRAEQGNGDQ